EYQINVADASEGLEVSLCWMDYPGNPSVTNQLVNDLNLTVTNGTLTFKGNNYNAQGVSVPGLSYDATNVEEAVRISGPTPGVWTVRVDGAYIPFGPQPFGLCITGGLGVDAGSIALDRANYGSASTVAIQVADGNAVGPLPVLV